MQTPKSKIVNLLVALFAMLLPWPHLAEAQQPPKVPRIGLLSPLSPSTHSLQLEAFRNGLRDLGYSEGKNIMIDYRFAEGKGDRLPELAVELARLKVDVMVVASVGATVAANLIPRPREIQPATVSGFLALPPGNDPLPVVILMHGCNGISGTESPG